jgi:hypothetical protein
MSVQATTDTEVESGAFRWDWSLPFESYGIDAYGQVTLKSEYGLGVESEGAAMAHGEYKMDDDIAWMAEGDVQVKGYADESYRVKTQYNVTLWEWEVFVDGRADLMAWDMYLNLSARDTQSAYHEFFLSIQVEENQPFTMDELFVMGNFDVGWYNPWHRPLGVSIAPVTIARPYQFQEQDVVAEPEPTVDPPKLAKDAEGISDKNYDAPVETSEIGTGPSLIDPKILADLAIDPIGNVVEPEPVLLNDNDKPIDAVESTVASGCVSAPVRKADNFGLVVLLLLSVFAYRWMARE